MYGMVWHFREKRKTTLHVTQIPGTVFPRPCWLPVKAELDRRVEGRRCSRQTSGNGVEEIRVCGGYEPLNVLREILTGSSRDRKTLRLIGIIQCVGAIEFMVNNEV